MLKMRLMRLKMPVNKKPRKTRKYVPKTIPLTIRHSEETETALQLAPHAELMKLREGYGDEGSWNTIVARLNIGLVAANAAGKEDQAKETAHLIADVLDKPTDSANLASVRERVHALTSAFPVYR